MVCLGGAEMINQSIIANTACVILAAVEANIIIKFNGFPPGLHILWHLITSLCGLHCKGAAV